MFDQMNQNFHTDWSTKKIIFEIFSLLRFLVSLSLFLYFSICLSVYLSIYLPICLSIYPYLSLFDQIHVETSNGFDRTTTALKFNAQTPDIPFERHFTKKMDTRQNLIPLIRMYVLKRINTIHIVYRRYIYTYIHTCIYILWIYKNVY